MYQLLVINPGSTSTKIAVYQNETPIFTQSIDHSTLQLAPFETITSQFDFRKELILATLKKEGFPLKNFTAIVARGGLLPPVKAGAYTVNEAMVWQLKYAPIHEHASNLGALIAYEIGTPLGIPAYIYDAVGIDEMPKLNKLTGWKEIEKDGAGHNLNMRATAMKYAKELGKSYQELTVIVAHLGGGISISLHHQGRIVDMINDEVGGFSPERAGALPINAFVRAVFNNKWDQETILKKLKSQGGLSAHLGTNDSREVEQRIENGDAYATLVYNAMAMNVACNIARQFPIVNGKVEAILLTGGIAHSPLFTSMLKERLAFLGPIKIYPGENEMEALAFGALRVLQGKEVSQEYLKVE